MPSPSLRDLIAEIADLLRANSATALTGTGFAVQVEPHRIVNPSPPCIDVYPGDPFRDQVGAGFGDVAGRVLLTVRARIDTPDNEAAQDWLVDLMDEEHELSVAATLMDDQTLGGTASSVFVSGCTGFRVFSDLGQAAHLGCEWTVEVLRAYS